VQGGLDVVSLGLDATGIGALISWIRDVLNSGISLARGDWVGAGLSVAAAIPGVGNGANASRLARIQARALRLPHSEAYAYKLIDEFGDVVKYGITSNPANRVAKYARELKDSFVGMEIISKPLARYHALELETRLVNKALDAGLPILNKI
jgi:hypothetical protein